MKGHVLGHPSARPKGLAPERNMSPVVVGIIRILMHCAMIEGACRHPQVSFGFPMSFAVAVEFKTSKNT